MFTTFTHGKHPITLPCKIRILAFISQVCFHNQCCFLLKINKELTTFTCIQLLFSEGELSLGFPHMNEGHTTPKKLIIPI